MGIRAIEVHFAMPVELTSNEMRQICEIVNDAARRTETDEMVHWQSGCGSRPKFSKSDCKFLGKEPDDDAPETGEPTWDDEVFYVETFTRERYETERRKHDSKSQISTSGSNNSQLGNGKDSRISRQL